jgi:hypothetical protein
MKIHLRIFIFGAILKQAEIETFEIKYKPIHLTKNTIQKQLKSFTKKIFGII